MPFAMLMGRMHAIANRTMAKGGVKEEKQEFIQSELSRISESKQTKIIRNPKELKMFKKSISMLVMALFVFSFIAVPAVFADEMQKISGTVDYFNPATGELTIKDDTGDVKKLKAGPDVDMESLKNLKQGDSINVECDSKGIITSLVAE
jgi:cold shock CspA family protein